MTEDKKKVSIVIPVYNVSAYLEECIQSILGQTYDCLEILIVDDGSTDKSGEICDRYAAMDERVKVVHQTNGGAGKAKNTALERVTGDYVTFVDSDDWLEENFIEKLVVTLEDTGADIVHCAFSEVRKSHREYMDSAPYGQASAQTYLKRFLQDWTCCLLWNKLFKAELLRGLRFYEGRVIDDEFFTYRAVMRANKIEVIKDSLYCYRLRKTGVTNQGRWKQRMKDRLAYYTERYENVTKAFPSLKEAYLCDLADNLMRAKTETHEFPDLTKSANQCMRRIAGKVVFSKIPWKMKVGFLKTWWTKPKNIGNAQESEAWEDFFD